MLKKLEEILKTFRKEIKDAKDKKSHEELKRKYASRDSALVEISRDLKDLDPDQKREFGIKINEVRTEVFSALNELEDALKYEELKKQLEKEKIDISLQGMTFKRGSKHPLNLVIDEISDIFTELGYEMVSGTEFESDEYCFQKLNMPIGHPARDMQDTFYVDEKNVLRTHCTNMTARRLTQLSKMNVEEKSIASISYGNVYRRDDDDATHSHQFMQIDGFAVGKKINFATLKWTLEYMCKRLFSPKTKIRLRPSFFPFTEPSCEVDISCVNCSGSGCKVCKNTGWIEILGSGMIAPEVIEQNGLDSNEVGGLAFGIGVERVAMLKFGINNIRDFYENDIRFLEQFKFFGD
ncbi:phenylalanine--tRNA ligase subunit alpha [Spiroplasma tabanidicola]|uniref:Phenylalanine--tRNA ligase alpha subunit n=1 Tax=Spiroplasma tabanidicola TaxID=324079 RepID=A0A6I6C989_9MOLU|nr:phenylalanine--tRNA ligase subunit alpha [Spiroplasma tabanidicola]QGS52166.1 phenylalanyl-tRNA synthetase subunit alpha [Spiroplasma tabanidicola]